jgi:poly-beta-1,6 N-acetyl-D-glucosamine export porin PgaA
MAQTREEAVEAARNGHLEESISTLRSVIAAGDSSPDTAYDLALILTWAKRPREATDVFERADQGHDVPEYVLLAMTHAYWDQRRYAEGERLARRGVDAYPANAEWSKIAGMIAGEAAERADDPYSALREYAEARQRLPDDADLANAEAGVLARLRAPYAASAVLGHPDAGLEAEQAGSMVRWGSYLRPADPRLRFLGTDAALSRLNAQIAAAARATPRDEGLLRRLQRDRAIALRDRKRWQDTVSQTEALKRGGDHLPPYVLQAEADALLALRHPEEARDLYRQVLQAEPQNHAAYVGLFYAEVETEDFGAAFRTVDALAAGHAPFSKPGNGGETWSKPVRFGDQILAGLARNYADMNAEAWRRLYPLSEQAPALGYLRQALGSVAAARGWPRRADEEIRIAASLSPQDLGIRIALAESALRRRRYGEARRMAKELESTYPEDASVRRLAREIELFESTELRSESRLYGEGSGGGPNAPGTGVETVNRAYSPPFLDDRVRIVAGFDYAEARPPEGRVVRYRAGGGFEWRLPSVTVEAMGWDNLGTLHRGGGRLAVGWTPTDHWSFAADAQLFTVEEPLRALLYGITANSASISAGYDWNESTGLGGSLLGVNFSDGNQRIAFGSHFVHRIVDRPHLKVAVRPEIYASHNTLHNAPYFNPLRDLSVFPGFDAVHIFWRRYERTFRQHIGAGAGMYWQDGHGTNGIVTVTYEHIVDLNDAMALRYGLTFARRSYDGDPVDSLTFSLGLSRRF